MQMFQQKGLGVLLAATMAIAAGCNLNVTTPPVATSSPSASASPSGTSSASPRPSASPSGTASASPRPSASPSASASPSGNTTTFYSCDTPVAATSSGTNNDFAVAQTITACSTVTGQFTEDNENHVFMIQVPAGVDGDLTFSLAEANNDLSVRWEIFDATKTSITSQYSADANTNPSAWSHNVTGGATYYVKLSGGVGADDATNFTLTTKFMPAKDTNEPNNTFDQAVMLTSGTAVNLMDFAGSDTDDGDDTDYFKIEVPAGATKINVKIANKSTAAEPNNFRVELYNAAKVSQTSQFGGGDQADFDETFDVETAGTYYLKVTGGGNSMIMSPMTVTVE